jgi:uncharacterized protein
MKLRSLFLLVSVLFLTNCFPTQTSENNSIKQTELNYPQPIGWVNDFASTFTAEERAQLDSLLQDYSHQTTNQIVIVTLKELPALKTIEEYTDELGDEWGVGLAEKNNGLVILLSMKDREIRISTGDGTQEFVSDEFVETLIDSTMIPKFKDKKFYEGIWEGLQKIIQEWDKNQEVDSTKI